MQSLRAPDAANAEQSQALMEAYTDITGAEVVHVQTAPGVVWVDVNGICVLRVCQTQTVSVSQHHSRQEKAPARTQRWVRVCGYVDQQARIAKRHPDDSYRECVIEYCIEERNKALNEGYDDTAVYLQHIINDMRAL